MVGFLKACPLDIFAATAFGQVDQLAAILDRHPEQVNIRFGEFRSHGQPTDRDWMTPLGFAIVNRRGEAVRFLLAQGADRSIRDVSGRSYRDLAREMGDEAIISLLRQSGSA
jgi:ankyrin repeat protein